MSELSQIHAERQRLRDKQYALADKQYLQREIDRNAAKIESLELAVMEMRVLLERVERRLGQLDSVEG